MPTGFRPGLIGGRIFRADAARLTRVRDVLRTARQQIDAVFTDYV